MRPRTPKSVPPPAPNPLVAYMLALSRELYAPDALPACLVELSNHPVQARVVKLCYLELLKRTHPDKLQDCSAAERERCVAAFARLRELWRVHGEA